MDSISALAAGLDAGRIAWALGSAALGYFVLGLTGFGSALVLVPLLAHHWPLTTVVPLVLLLDLPASYLHAWLNRTQIRWPLLWRLTPGLALGATVGHLLAPWLAHAWGLAVLGLYVMGVGVRGWRGAGASKAAPASAAPRKPPGFAAPGPDGPGPARATRDVWAGVAAGVIETCFGTAGPIVVSYLTQRLREVPDVRANTPPVLVLASALALGSLGAGGHLMQGLIALAYVPLLCISLVAVAAGHRVAHRVPARNLALGVFALLIVSGALLLARATPAL